MTRKKTIKILLLFSILTLFTSCTTVKKQESSDPSLTEKKLTSLEKSKIEKLIEGKKYFKALQEISFVEGEKDRYSFVRGYLDEARNRVYLLLENDFNKKIEEKNFREAYSIFLSMRNISPSLVPDNWTEKKLIMDIGHSYLEKGNKVIALNYLERATSLGKPTKGELDEILKLSYQLRNRRAYQHVRGLYSRYNLKIPEKYSEKQINKPLLASMAKGTVTVWVDRGIKIENGVGVPDRVIGSAFFIDPRGYLLTNYHVIKSEVDPEYEGYSRLYIRLSGQSKARIPAKVIGYDRVFDLALLKTEIEPDFVFYPASDVNVQPGNKVYAIGSPGGLKNTITSGIVSAVGRRFLQIGDAIQVDAPLNPGNSGGPLLNSNAELIGIVFAGIEQFEGVNFAIPWYWIDKVLPLLYDGGEVKHPWLGMALNEGEEGLEVLYLVPEEPAANTGILPGDFIVSFDGRKVKKRKELQSLILDAPLPSLAKLAWRHGDTVKSRLIAVTERPNSPVELALERDDKDRVLYPLFGFELENTGSFLWNKNYIVKRVITGSIADETGISKGDPLTIQGWKVDKKKKYAILQIYIKKRKAGFLESTIQLVSYLETDNFY